MKLKRIYMIAMFTTAAASPALAQNFTENFVGIRYGNSFAEPAIESKISKAIFNYTHVSGDSLGKNLIVVDVLMSNKKDPSANGGTGAQEFFGFYQRTFSLSAMTGNKTGYGFLKDIALLGRVDLQTKNTEFAPQSTKFRIGAVASLPVSAGFWDVSLAAVKETNHNGIVIPRFKPTGVNVSFDIAPVLSTSWLIPVAGLGTFQGYFDYVGAKGRNGFKDVPFIDSKTKAETHAQTEFMFYVGNPKNGWKIGPGVEYWNNKFGEHGTGTKQTTALILVQYKL